MFGFSPETVYKVLSDYGEEGRNKALFVGLVIDTAYPFVYGLLLTFMISSLLKKSFTPVKRGFTINIIPLFAIIFDYCENLSIAYMIVSFPNRLYGLPLLASIANMLKWSMVGISVSIALILLGNYLSRLYLLKK